MGVECEFWGGGLIQGTVSIDGERFPSVQRPSVDDQDSPRIVWEGRPFAREDKVDELLEEGEVKWSWRCCVKRVPMSSTW